MRSAATREKSRGRVERRELLASTRGAAASGWPGARQFLRLTRTTTVDGETTHTVQYAVTSLPPDRASPERLLAMWRGRWEIENRVFWVRDVVLREDASRIRSGTAPFAVGAVRNAALNYLRARGTANVAAAVRENALKVAELLRNLGVVKH